MHIVELYKYVRHVYPLNLITYECMNANVNIYKYVCIYVCMHACMYLCMYLCICACMYL